MKTKISLHTIYTVAMVAFVIAERFAHGWFLEKTNIFSQFSIAPYVGMVIGSFLLALLYSYFVEKKRIKTIVVIISTIIIITLFTWIPFLRETIIPAFFDAINANSNYSAFTQFMQGIVVGGTMGFFVYSSLAIFRTPLPAAFFYLSFMLNSAKYDKDEMFYMIVALLAIAILITIFVLVRYTVSARKWGAYLLILLLFVGAGSTFAYKIAVAILAEQQRKLDLIEEVRRKQQHPPVYVPREIPIDEPVGNPTIELVGFYQAPEPLYLKYELFKISQDSDKLRIVSVDPYSVASHSYWPSKNIAAKTARVIFAHFPSQGMLSPERLITYDTSLYTYADGVLAARYRATSERTTSYEFTYTHYDSTLPYIYNVPEDINYTSISTFSEGYDKIVSLTREITKGKYTDLEKAHAIEEYFHKNFIYTLNPHFNDKVNPIDDFLFETKKGYCVQYAVTTALMLDIAGVKSRMVGGYYSSLFVPGANAYVIVSRQAHVWNEVYVSSYGWVTIDSTPSVSSDKGEEKGVPLTEEEKAQIQVLLKAAAPVISFDDIYNNPIEELPLKPGQVIDNTQQQKLQEELEKQRQQEEERRKLEEEIKKKREEQVKIAKTAFYAFVVTGSVVGFGILVYLYIRNPEYVKNLILRFRLQSLDRKIRLKSVKKYNLPVGLVNDSSKHFQEKLPEGFSLRSEIKDYYICYNKVLYGKNTTKKEVEIVLKKGRKIVRRLSQNDTAAT